MPGIRPPEPWPVHRGDNGFFPSGAAQQLDPPVEQHPPEVGGVALAEEHIAVRESHLIAGSDQFEQLLVAEPVEQEDGAQVVDVHQIVAR